jgi:hypothetical protein
MSNDVETGPEAPRMTYPALSFDPEEFMEYIRDEDLTHEQALSLLNAVWCIVVAFVRLGFEVADKVPDNSGSGGESGPVPQSILLAFRDQASTHTGTTAAHGATHRSAGMEDS